MKWEKNFRTHGSPFRSQTVNKPVSSATIEGNHVAVCLEPDDLDTCMKILDSPATVEVMTFDGVTRETVKVFVLDKELKI